MGPLLFLVGLARRPLLPPPPGEEGVSACLGLLLGLDLGGKTFLEPSGLPRGFCPVDL